jgi:ADP-ribosylglycohydrolase
MTIKDRFRGCILGLAAGEAIARQFGEEETTNPEASFPEAGKYGPNTQLSVCVAEALIAAGDDEQAFCEILAAAFKSWFKAQECPDTERGAEGNCMAACERMMFGVHWEESGIPDAIGSGASARSAPIGLYHMDDITKAVQFGIASAQMTHKHPSALCSSVATALLTNMCMNAVPVGVWPNELMMVTGGESGAEVIGKPKGIDEDFNDHVNLAAKLVGRGAPPRVALTHKFLGDGRVGYEATGCALYCCMAFPYNFEKAVRAALNVRFDTPVVASIVGGWMGARRGVDEIPKEWVEKLEDSAKLSELADRLYAAKEASRTKTPKNP